MLSLTYQTEHEAVSDNDPSTLLLSAVSKFIDSNDESALRH